MTHSENFLLQTFYVFVFNREFKRSNLFANLQQLCTAQMNVSNVYPMLLVAMYNCQQQQLTTTVTSTKYQTYGPVRGGAPQNPIDELSKFRISFC